jgi:hypothetical protein
VEYEQDTYSAVDFERTFLPPKSLYRDVGERSILGESDGGADYRQTGFPNVVMALDTTKMDPSYLYFPLGYDLKGAPNSATRKMFRNMIVLEGYRLGVLRLRDYRDGPSAPTNGNFSSLDDVYFKGPWVVSIPLGEGGKLIETEIKLDERGSFPSESAVGDLSKSLSKSRKSAAKSYKAGRFSESSQKRENALKAYEEGISKISNVNLTSGEVRGEMTIVDLINVYKYAIKLTGQGVPEAGSASSIISLLSDKKASFNPNQPGYYRYFSSAHPDPRHQAPDVLEVSEEGDVSLKEARLSRPDATKNNMVIPVNGDVVRFAESAPVRGLVTKTFYTQKAQPTATKDILALSFTKHTVKTPYTVSSVDIGGGVRVGAFLSGIGSNILGLLKRAHKKGIKGSQLEQKVLKTRPNPKGASMKSTASFIFGADGNRINAVTPVKVSDLPTIAQKTLSKISASASADYPDMFGAVTDKTETAISNFISDMTRIYRNQSVVYSAGVKRGKTSTRYKENTFLSPIFPISDENGYEVFGAYQYGRGLDIIPRNTFDQILRSDLTRVFTEEELDLFLEDLYKSPSSARGQLVARAADRILKREGGIEEASSRYGLKDVSGKDQFITELNNAIAKRDDGQIVANVPVTISQIRPETRDKAECSCRRTDDDLVSVLLSSGNSSFVSIADSGISDVVLPYKEQILARAEEWKRHQDALKGNVEVTGASPITFSERLSTNTEGFEIDGDASIGDAVESIYDQTIGQSTDSLSKSNDQMREAFRDLVRETKEKEDG